MLERFDKDYLKGILLRIGGSILALALAFYVGYQAWRFFATNAKCELAEPFTVYEKSSGEGCVFRYEAALSDADGSLVPSVNSGTKVAIGDEVARFYAFSSPTIQNRLKEINEQIALLSSANVPRGTSGKDLAALDGNIYSAVTEMNRNIAKGNFDDALAYKSGLITDIAKRNIASENVIDLTGQISALESEKNTLTGQLGTLRKTLYSPLSGWYYPECDGYEDAFTVDKIKSLTYDSFRELVSTSPTVPGTGGKIVTDCNWYFVCELSAESLKAKEAGKEYTLYFPYNRNEKLTMTLEKICDGTEGYGAAVFATDRIPADFDFLRMQSYEILEKEYTGFKVPKTAVRILDGQMGVFVLSGEIVHFRKIDVMTEYENSYIVEMNHSENETDGETDSETPSETDEDKFVPANAPWLKAHENIIIEGKGMKEGRIITNMK